MDRTHRGLAGFAAVVALVIGACATSGAAVAPADATAPVAVPTSSTTPTAGSPTAVPVDVETPEPTAEPTPTPESTPTSDPGSQATPTPEPQSTPSAEPTPAPVAAAGWTLPRRVGSATGCVTVTAEIDAAGRYHLAAECEGSIHYYFSTDGGGSWSARVFSHAAHREELAPQIAFQGDVVYVAYSRIIPDGGCGGSRGPDVGVYVRSRSLPGGAWSAATRIGSAGDGLEAFDVAGGTLHATVKGADGLSYYETLQGTTYHRYRISRTEIGVTSMSIGSDGRARIAYAAGQGGIRFATFTGSGFSTARIAGTVEYDMDPVLSLDGKDQARVVWTRYEPAACGLIPAGTYFASNASGSWKAQRITKAAGTTCLAIDDATGRAHVLVGSDSGLAYYTSASAGPWTRTRIAASDGVTSPTIRLAPAGGALLVAYIDAARNTSAIYVLTTT